jgi:HTH-type transcriptional regulator/antitoxin HigA
LDNANELKSKYRNASVLSSKRVVFNIKGNDYRLIVDIEYRLKIVFVVWFGTHAEYNKACQRIYSLIKNSATAIEPDSPAGEEIDLLSLLVEKYEMEFHRLEAPDPVEAIKFRMEQMDLRQADIAPLFGGKTRVSEVLGRRRPLTLKMITLLNRYLGIPLESLVSGNKEIKLEGEKKEKLLSISSIQEYLKGGRAAMI